MIMSKTQTTSIPNLVKIRQLLSRNNYEVIVRAENPLTIRMEFPAIINTEIGDFAQNTLYQIQDETIKVGDVELELSNCAKRAFLFSDIVRRSFLIFYNPILIKFAIADKFVNEIKFFEYLDIKLSEEDEVKEDSLREVMIKFFLEDENEVEKSEKLEELAEKLEVEEEFALILSYLS